MASVPDLSLEAGLLALNQQDYPAAIAHLEAVCQNNLNSSTQFKAQIGLVTAYERTGKISRAIALCQKLSHSSVTQVREWAVTKQVELIKAQQADDSTLPETDLTGFVSFNSPSSEVGIQNTSVRSQESGVVGAGLTDISVSKQTIWINPPVQKSECLTPLLPLVDGHLHGRGENTHGSVLPLSPCPPTSPTPHLPHWRQAGRAKQWQPLSKVSIIPLWLLQAGTAIALFWLIRELLKFFMGLTNEVLYKLPYIEPFQLFYSDPTQFVLLMLGILLGASPWLLDRILRLFYGFQSLSISTLSTHSPEASRVLQRYCQQRHWSLPQLGILPTSAPIALTYGNLPRTARIVVSQGLLKQLADDEIATIYASQLGHIANWDFVVMSLSMVVTQLPYIVYWQVSQWGDKRANVVLHLGATAIATFCYGIWYLLSLPAFWLSQLRIYYSDRFATQITGNPNGLTRALLKIAIGIAKDVQQQGHTSWLLESLNLLAPVGYIASLSLGSVYPHTSFESVLAWDCLNPYRYWLTINNTHPLMGDRLQRLFRIAHHWNLATELNLDEREVVAPISNLSLRSFWLQLTPFLGIPLGVALGMLSWLIGGISTMLHIDSLSSMYGDWVIIKGCLPIGFSIGTFLRVNAFFPDINSSTVQAEPNLPQLLANPSALPINSQPIRLQGKLLGRRGISNWLGQNLILHSRNGSVKLHYFFFLGSVGNILPRHSPHPSDLIGRQIVATGWFRRGATVWIDIDTLRTQGGKTISSSHPVWSTLLASAAAIWGSYIILRGGT